MRNEKWIFTMDQEFDLCDIKSFRPATAYFRNGYLKCMIVEGFPVNKSDNQPTLKVDGMIKPVSEIRSDGTIITSDGTIFFLNFKRKIIENSLIVNFS